MHDSSTLQLVLTAVAACALALQTIFMIVIAVIALKALKTVREELDNYRSAVMPIIEKAKPIVDKAHDVVENVAPKIEEVSTQLTVMAKSLREQTADIQVAANDIIDRTRRQASRVDGMMTSVLNKVEHAGIFVADSVAKPMRQLSGMIAWVKAAVETLREPEVTSSPRAPRPVSAVAPRYSEVEPAQPPRVMSNTTSFRP